MSISAGQQVVNDYTHKIVVKEDGTQSMIIVHASPDDSGEWTVVAQNRAGKTTISMTLTVEGIYSAHFGKNSIIIMYRNSYFNFCVGPLFSCSFSSRTSSETTFCRKAEEC